MFVLNLERIEDAQSCSNRPAPAHYFPVLLFHLFHQTHCNNLNPKYEDLLCATEYSQSAPGVLREYSLILPEYSGVLSATQNHTKIATLRLFPILRRWWRFAEFFVYLAKNPLIEEMHHTLCPSCNCLNDGF